MPDLKEDQPTMMISDILNRVNTDFDPDRKGIHTFLNPFTYKEMRKHINILREFDTLHFDGIMLCKIFEWFGIGKVPRRSFDMTSVARDVLENAGEKNLSIAFVGTEEGVIDDAVNKLKDSFNLNVCLARHGFFGSDEEIDEFQEHLLEIAPDIVIVGMGAVRQEAFLNRLKQKGFQGSGYTCGGFLHQTADKLDYYPEFMNTLNLRWLYRVIKDPYVIKRYCLDYPKFLVCFYEDYKKWKRMQSAAPEAGEYVN